MFILVHVHVYLSDIRIVHLDATTVPVCTVIDACENLLSWRFRRAMLNRMFHIAFLVCVCEQASKIDLHPLCML